MNISLPKSQEQFVRDQVKGGRYRTASEVVRDGLRLLEDAEHRRLVEKWIYQDLSPEELEGLPQSIKDRTREFFSNLVAQGNQSGEEDGWEDGPATLEAIAAKRKTCQKSASPQ